MAAVEWSKNDWLELTANVHCSYIAGIVGILVQSSVVRATTLIVGCIALIDTLMLLSFNIFSTLVSRLCRKVDWQSIKVQFVVDWSSYLTIIDCSYLASYNWSSAVTWWKIVQLLPIPQESWRQLSLVCRGFIVLSNTNIGLIIKTVE